MAKSKYEYVKEFEEFHKSLPETYMVVRLDGRAFTKMCKNHNFTKPNDKKALMVMNEAAKHVMNSFQDIFLAYGQSDEYSFVFKKDSDVFERRNDKIVSCVTSLFTASYCLNFEPIYGSKLKTIPSFDGRVVCYPNEKVLVDYFSWRQVDCHVNNLYNTIFWKLVESGLSGTDAEQKLKGTLSADKNEILYSEFGINYSNEDPQFRKGTILKRVWVADPKKVQKYEEMKENNPEMKLHPPRKKQKVVEVYEDLIKWKFWKENFPGYFN